MPLVSVIVPNYNHAAFLKQRIDSILNQTFQDFELILLDDCSTDGSRDIIEYYRKDPHVSHVLFNDENSGRAFRQWKKGIDLAQGEWVWIAESDDWAEPEFLATMLTEASCYPNCGLLVSLPQYCYPDGKTWNQEANLSVVKHYGHDFAQQRMACANPIHNVSSILMRRSNLSSIDLSLVTSMRLCGDWMLYAQLCRVTDVLEINKVLSHYRIHGSNVTSWAEQNGLPFVEGVEVLDYLTGHDEIKPRCYARSWGRSWAKSERDHCYDTVVCAKIRQKLKHYPSILFWHSIYCIRLCLK